MASSSSSSHEPSPSVPMGTNSVLATLEEYKLAIGNYVATQATGLTPEAIASALKVSPTKECDYTLAVPALNQIAKQPGNPQELSRIWASNFSSDKTNGLIKSVVANGVFLHWHINSKLLTERVLHGIFLDKERYGNSTRGNGETIIVEYSSPNMAKPFHAGHLRSTIIGNFLRNLHECLGYKTIAMNYLGDWGKQYGLLAIGFDRYGDEEKLRIDPIRHLYDVYVAINQDAKQDPAIHEQARLHFAKMEAGDPEALVLWKRFRELSIEKSKEIYSRMNIHFDVYSGESMYPASKQQDVIHRLESLNLLIDETTEKGVCRAIDLTKYNLGKVIFQKSDGSLLYISRDIAAALDRAATFHFHKMIYVVASQQILHFQQLFKILELIGFEQVKNCVHVNFGLVRGMSTRAGTVVFLEDILDTTRDTNLELMKKNPAKYAEVSDPVATADTVGVSAVVIQDLIAKRIKDYDFSYERMLQTQGDTGAYLQFAHVRIASIMRKANIPVTVEDVDLSLLTEPECSAMIAQLADYPSILLRAADELEPSIVVQYALKLTHLISSLLKKMHVKRAPTPEIGKARMLFFWAAKQTLENALRLLSLQPLERM